MVTFDLVSFALLRQFEARTRSENEPFSIRKCAQRQSLSVTMCLFAISTIVMKICKPNPVQPTN